ncbi:MAG: Smr/MutS family protein [Oscillospiraceae bacterium]|nr:Smr/MutS family protein [Oscillospiraceae bacterium]
MFKEVDIHADMPTADLAVRRVTYNLKNAKQLGVTAIKFIHGWGSTGKGGVIRVRVRQYLGEQKRKGLVREVICGEDFSIFDEATRRAFLACGALRRDPDLERGNNGVTIVVV